MKRSLVLLLLATLVAGRLALAQTYVTPKMGGGQVAADMVHIDLYYDADANEFHAHVDDTYGTPELRALAAGSAFDPQAAYAVLNGRAYNAQYGWNASGFFTIPAGAAIWIEQTNGTPGLEVYADWGRYGTYTPLFGTAGSPRKWKWSGVMVHNTYAVLNPTIGRLAADYHIYFGDATTGARAGFEGYDDAFVRLEWTTVPVEDPLTFKFGAVALTNGAPLSFLNEAGWVTNGETVVNLWPTNGGGGGGRFERGIPLVAVAATAAHGGPVTNHAALGSCLEWQLEGVTGPREGQLSFWEPAEAQPRFTVRCGAAHCTNRFRLSENQGLPGSDPYGGLPGRRFSVNQAGLYAVGFRLLDSSTNGAAHGPVHTPSRVYWVYFQAGLTLAAQERGAATTALFGGEPGKTFRLERTLVLGPTAQWQTVAGPLAGTNRLQRLTDAPPPPAQAFYRVRAQ